MDKMEAQICKKIMLQRSFNRMYLSHSREPALAGCADSHTFVVKLLQLPWHRELLDNPAAE